MSKPFFYCEKCSEEVLPIDMDHNENHIRCGNRTYFYTPDPQVEKHLEKVKSLTAKYKAIFNEKNKHNGRI